MMRAKPVYRTLLAALIVLASGAAPALAANDASHDKPHKKRVAAPAKKPSPPQSDSAPVVWQGSQYNPNGY